MPDQAPEIDVVVTGRRTADQSAVSGLLDGQATLRPASDQIPEYRLFEAAHQLRKLLNKYGRIHSLS